MMPNRKQKVVAKEFPKMVAKNLSFQFSYYAPKVNIQTNNEKINNM